MLRGGRVVGFSFVGVRGEAEVAMARSSCRRFCSSSRRLLQPSLPEARSRRMGLFISALATSFAYGPSTPCPPPFNFYPAFPSIFPLSSLRCLTSASLMWKDFCIVSLFLYCFTGIKHDIVHLVKHCVPCERRFSPKTREETEDLIRFEE